MSKKDFVTKLQDQVHEIIFEADTRAGKIFDVSLLILILLSILVIMLETVPNIRLEYKNALGISEWVITILFTIEYGLRIFAVQKPLRYIFSFYGIVDFLAILPTYLSLFTGSGQFFSTIRALRLLRAFRVLKLTHYVKESQVLFRALKASRRKITVFLGAVLTIVVIVGSLMYFIEGRVNPKFDSIPRTMYWAIVTLTTVGYGDITPVTTLGQVFSAMLMILGYGVLAVPTGIVSVELASASSDVSVNTRSCKVCSMEGHDDDAVHCKYCGSEL